MIEGLNPSTNRRDMPLDKEAREKVIEALRQAGEDEVKAFIAELMEKRKEDQGQNMENIQ